MRRGKQDKRGTFERYGISLGKSAGYWIADFDHVSNGKAQRKRKRLLPLARPEEEARVALERFAVALRTIKTAQAAATIGELWQAWLADRAKDGFSNKIYSYQWRALGAFFANLTPETLTRDDWRTYAETRFAAGIAPATVHSELSRLSVCLKYSFDVGAIAKRPKHWLPAKGKKRDRVLTPEEARALIEAARQGDPHIEVFVVLLFATGGRHTAVLDLEWTRVDFERGTINLEMDLPPDPMHKTWHKGRANVIMSRSAREVLERAYAGRTCAHVIEHGGRRMKSCRVGFAAACDRAGLKGVTPHTIRHTLASWAHGQIATEFTRALLGHAPGSATTLEVYTHTSAEATRQVVEHIDGVLAALPSFDKSGRVAEGNKGEIGRNLSIVDIVPEGED